MNIQTGECNDGRLYIEIETPDNYKILTAHQVGNTTRIEYTPDITDEERTRREAEGERAHNKGKANAYNQGRQDAYKELIERIETLQDPKTADELDMEQVETAEQHQAAINADQAANVKRTQDSIERYHNAHA